MITEQDIDRMSELVVDGMADAGIISDEQATNPDRYLELVAVAKKSICAGLPCWMAHNGIERRKPFR